MEERGAEVSRLQSWIDPIPTSRSRYMVSSIWSISI